MTGISHGRKSMDQLNPEQNSHEVTAGVGFELW